MILEIDFCRATFPWLDHNGLPRDCGFDLHDLSGRMTASKQCRLGLTASSPVRSLILVPLLALVIGIAGCGTETTETSLGQLVRQQNAYNGRLVITRGTLRSYGTPRHYWIEDVTGNRVEIIGLRDPDSRLGNQLRVEGRFLYAANRGRRIEVVHFRELP